MDSVSQDWQSDICRFGLVEHPTFFSRDLQRAPKDFSECKLLSSIVRNQVARFPEPVHNLVLCCDDALFSRAKTMFAEFDSVQHVNSFGRDLFQCLANLDSEVVLASIGKREYRVDHTFMQFARMLMRFDPEIQENALRFLIMSGEEGFASSSEVRLVWEEKPGKFSLLESHETPPKSISKKLHQALSRDYINHIPYMLEECWSMTAAVFSPKRGNWALAEFDCRSDLVNIDGGKVAIEKVLAWVESSTELKTSAIESVQINCAIPIVAGHIAEVVTESLGFKPASIGSRAYYGFQPEVSFLEGNDAKNALQISIGTDCKLEATVVW